MQLFRTLFIVLFCFSIYTKAQQNDAQYFLKQLKTETNDTSKILLYLKLSTFQSEIDTINSEKYLAKAEQLLKKTNWKKGWGKYYYFTARHNFFIGNFKNTISDCEKSITYAKNNSLLNVLTDSYNLLGLTYDRLNNFTKSMEIFYEGYEVIKNNNVDKKAAVILLDNLRNGYLRQENLKKYFKISNEVEKLAKELKDTASIINTYLGYGETYKQMKDYKNFELYTQKAIDLSEKFKDYNLLALSIGNMATVIHYTSIKNKDEEKIKMLWRVNELLENEKNFEIYYYYFKGYLGIELLKLSQNDSLLRVLNIKHLPKNKSEIKSLSEKYISEVYKIYNENKLYDNIMDFEGQLSLAYNQMGDFKNAYKSLQKHQNLKDSIFSQAEKNKIASAESQILIDKKNAELALKEVKVSNQKKQMLFLIVSFLLLSLIAGLLYKQFSNRKILKEAELKSQLNEVTLSALRSQMNPHFIFNSLNSINSFVLNNNSIHASKYISDFSKLIRLILENSKTQKITVQKDIQTLELYIKMEQLRFNNSFDYKIKIDENIDTDFIEIPPMIIQPFIENAIWHGLHHLQNKKGMLEIIVTLLHENALQIEITDNGIGRKKSEALKQNAIKKHTSFGLQITKDRLDIENKEKNSQISNIEIIDLYDESHNSIGTKVILIIQV
jgi:tetratricopeptide (TPR) repeat protein